ncbi:MAG: NADH-quinone oxidoreductase subunit C [Gaiellales bacterium]
MSTHSGATYREALTEALAGGLRFAGLHASEDGAIVRAALVGQGGEVRLETVAAKDGAVPSIVDLAPSGGWDEREAHDLYGVRFDGHEPLRPLVDHDLVLTHWTAPVRGHDPYQVAVGPIHAGVIESGHFRFHVVGDRILHLDARLFYKHRGLERAAEGRALGDGAAYVGRACAACAVANGVAYAHACEDALGLEPSAELGRARTILLELERVWNHLNDIGQICAGVGLAAGNNRFAGLTERARRLNATVAGHRFLFGAIRIGGSTFELDAAAVASARNELEALRTEATGAWRELQFNASFQDRLPDVGVLGPGDVERLGTVGPAARAAGVNDDARTGDGRLAYAGFAAALSGRPAGDVQARLEQRAVELWQSFAILDALLDRPLGTATATRGGPEGQVGIGRVESPRGATLCVVERSGNRLDRVRLRTGSYANWPSVAFAATDNLLPDFPLVNKSFELCYACADR